MICLVFFVILEIDGEDGWAIEVKLLTLAAIEDDNILNLAVTVKASGAHKENEDSETGCSSRKCLQYYEPLGLHCSLVLLPKM